MHNLRSAFAIICIVLPSQWATAEEHDDFTIKVVDDATGRGVPLVELKTVNNIRDYTDSAGIVAFSEPGLMNRTVFFHVKSHVYEYPKDGFGHRGARLKIAPGGEATLKIKRINIAERLYRVTGAGIYRHSVLVGRPVPTRQPVLNGQVFGSDSVWYGSPQWQIDALWRFQIPEEMRETYGYPELTDAARRKILGLTSARLYGITPVDGAEKDRRYRPVPVDYEDRIPEALKTVMEFPGYAADNMATFKERYAALGPTPSNTRYGWMRTTV